MNVLKYVLLLDTLERGLHVEGGWLVEADVKKEVDTGDLVDRHQPRQVVMSERTISTHWLIQ